LRSQNLDNSFKRDIHAHLFDASYHKHKCSGIPFKGTALCGGGCLSLSKYRGC
jgi:hypothetical protein